MPEYMLSVNHVEDEPTPSGEEMQQAFDAVDRFNTRLQDAGAWVFAGGLMPRETATTVDNTGEEPVVTDGPFAETKEWLGGFWVIEAPDLDAALRWAEGGLGRLRRPGRGPAVPGRVTRDAAVTSDDADAAIERIFRDEFGRVVASLARRFGDLDIAEDAASEALVVALEKWRADGIPPNPGGWLTTTAGNRAIDRIRREPRRDDKHRQAEMMSDPEPHEPTGPVEDDRLRLIFTCCHPALAPEARVALTLRLLGGLTVAEIAAAFLVPETTMAQRITRAKRKIAGADIPYRVPGGRPPGAAGGRAGGAVPGVQRGLPRDRR